MCLCVRQLRENSSIIPDRAHQIQQNMQKTLTKISIILSSN